MNTDIEIEQHIHFKEREKGMDKMQELFEVAMFEVKLDPAIMSAIIRRVDELRSEK